MADPIEILASDAHANVPHVVTGVTPRLAGWRPGGVPPAMQAKSAPVAVIDYSTLRLTLDVTSITNRQGAEDGTHDPARLHVALETRSYLIPHGAPWRLLHTFDPISAPGSQRVVITEHDDEIRASYYFARSNMPATIREEVAFTFSLTGDALPEAAV